jgi:hypothetical protein
VAAMEPLRGLRSISSIDPIVGQITDPAPNRFPAEFPLATGSHVDRVLLRGALHRGPATADAPEQLPPAMVSAPWSNDRAQPTMTTRRRHSAGRQS